MSQEDTYIVISGPYSNIWLAETSDIPKAKQLLQMYQGYGWNEAFIVTHSEAIEINLNKSDFENLLGSMDIW